jgi:formiminotetrahydrofolate cyclodeaminase
MAARFSEKHLGGSSELAARAEELRKRALPLAREDAESYRRVISAYRLPRDEDPERREREIREALSGAAGVPLEVTEVGAEAAELAARLARSGNPNLKGDAVAAALLAEAAVRAAANLAEINLSGAKGGDDPRLGRLGDLQRRASEAREQVLEG